MSGRRWLKAASLAGAIALMTVIAGTGGAAYAAVGQPVLVSPPGHVVGEFRAETSPADPQVLVASAMDSDVAPHTRCAVYVSRDGGGHWSEVPVWPTGPQNHGGDPWVTADANGVLHATCIMSTRPQSVLYTNSHDQGQSWAPPRRVVPLPAKLESADKQALAVADDGTAFVCLTENLSDINTRTLVVARSGDEGATWTARDTGITALCNGIVTAPGGDVTVVFIRPDDLRYGTVTSTTGGESWQAPVYLGALSSTNFQMPAITREADGDVVVAAIAGAVAQHIEVSVETGDGQLVRSFALANPPSPTCASGRLIQPALTAAPTGPAALQVACKVDPTTSQAGRMEVWLYQSIDTTPPAPIQVTGIDLPARRPPTDSFAKRFPDGGDYWSLTWITGGLFSMWVDPTAAGGPGPLMGAPVTG
jgi:BNR repeat protein